MHDRMKRLLTNVSWGNILLIIFGLILIIHPDFASGTVVRIIAWIMIAMGAVALLFSLISWPAFGFGSLIGSSICLLFGIYLAHHPLSIVSILGIFLGVLLTSQGIGTLTDSLRVRYHGGGWIFGTILGGITVTAGLILIFSPMTTSRIVMTVIGIVMILCGAANLYTRNQTTKYIKSSESSHNRIIDADD